MLMLFCVLCVCSFLKIIYLSCLMIERLDQMTYSVRMDKLGQVSYIAFFFSRKQIRYLY